MDVFTHSFKDKAVCQYTPVVPDFRPLCYIVISRPAWITDPVFGEREKEEEKSSTIFFFLQMKLERWSSNVHVFIKG